jgi:hypothetical protein
MPSSERGAGGGAGLGSEAGVTQLLGYSLK